MPWNLLAKVPYLANDPLFETEKPYSVAFPLDNINGAKQTNHILNAQEVTIQDARALPHEHRLDISGFQHIESALLHSPDQLESVQYVKQKYFPDIVQALKRAFPHYKEILFSDHVVRKRDPNFPAREGAKVPYAQPLSLPHLDYTSNSSKLRLSMIVSEDRFAEIGDVPYDQINVWRVLNEPNNDWPLAVCDYRTIDPVNDTIANDLVFRDVAGESVILREGLGHRWYYLSDQCSNELLVFRNATSPGREAPKAFHASFDAASARNIVFPFRESIEVRVFALLE